MKKDFFSSVLIFGLIALMPLQSGCVLFLLGAGAAGGYAISKDELEGIREESWDKVWSAARESIQKEGAITLEDKSRGHLEALVSGSSVEANIEQVTPKTVRVRIKARRTKGLFPDMKTAERLYNQLIQKLD